MRRFLWILILSILAIVGGIIYYRYFMVLGTGVKSGELNFVVHKGYIFKTYEGKLIQAGIRSRGVGTVQSYEFDFSIVDKAIAEKLMLNSGKVVDLRYREYIGTLPWRGYNKYVVDSIIAIREPAH